MVTKEPAGRLLHVRRLGVGFVLSEDGAAQYPLRHLCIETEQV
jgi:hypothetical protein